MAKKFSFKSLLAEDSLTSDLWLHKEAKEQPDEVQFAQDFANIAFQFMQDRAPALMRYLLGFEVVDRAENGTRAVGIFGFKIDGDYYYVPAFFMNNQVKGIDSILSKRTNSFVPLMEDWVNYIINRKANELGKEAPKEDLDGEGQAQFENPSFDFLRTPRVGPLGNSGPYKVAEDQTPWSFQKAWEKMAEAIDEYVEKDASFREALVGFTCACHGVRTPVEKKAESPLQSYIEKIGGPMSERTFLSAFGNVKFANAALEFYKGVSAFHVDSYPKDCYLLNKKAQEISDKLPKVEVVDTPKSEAEARDVMEDGFTIRDIRDDDEKSDIIETNYEENFQNPDRPGVYDVLVTGGVTKRAYVFAADRIFHRGAAGTMIVYFPDNKQVLQAKNRDIFVEGGCKDGIDSVYEKGSDAKDISLRSDYIYFGKNGTALPSFHVQSLKREKGERPVISGTFEYFADNDYTPDPEDAFTNYWQHDQFHHRNGLQKLYPSEMAFCDIELADFTGSPKFAGNSVVIPSDWKTLKVGESYASEFSSAYLQEDGEKRKDPVVYKLGSIDSLTWALRKQGAAKLDVRSEDGQEFYFSFDGGAFTRPQNYKQASIMFVTRLGMRYPDAKKLLKKAAVERSTVCLVKMAQAPFVGVSTTTPPDQTPGVDPYTGIPSYESPYVDRMMMPFNGVELPPQDNPYGENLDGDITRQSEGSGEAEFDPEAAQLAENAAQLGQKDVFDKAAIGGLAKVYDTGAVIDSYIPEFLTAVDRLGRLLFLYYWKHNDFNERYGTDDVIEMEDVLRGTFKQLGKLTLDLKKKAVGGGDSDASIDTIGS